MPRSVSALATASWTGAFNAFQCLRIGDRVEGCHRNDTEAGNECGPGER